MYFSKWSLEPPAPSGPKQTNKQVVYFADLVVARSIIGCAARHSNASRYKLYTRCIMYIINNTSLVHRAREACTTVFNRAACEKRRGSIVKIVQKVGNLNFESV